MWLCPSCWPLSWSHRWCCGWVGAARAHSVVWGSCTWAGDLCPVYFLSSVLSLLAYSCPQKRNDWLTQKQTNSTSHIPCYRSLLSCTINPLIASYCYCYTVVKDIWFFKVKVSCQVIHWQFGCWLWDFPTCISYSIWNRRGYFSVSSASLASAAVPDLLLFPHILLIIFCIAVLYTCISPCRPRCSHCLGELGSPVEVQGLYVWRGCQYLLLSKQHCSWVDWSSKALCRYWSK